VQNPQFCLTHGRVGALNVFLCLFQADFWHSAEQQNERLHRAQSFDPTELLTSHLRVGFFTTSSTSTSSALSYFMCLMKVQAVL